MYANISLYSVYYVVCWIQYSHQISCKWWKTRESIVYWCLFLLHFYHNTFLRSLVYSNFSKNAWSHVKYGKAKQNLFLPVLRKQTLPQHNRLEEKIFRIRFSPKRREYQIAPAFLFSTLNRYYVCMVCRINAVLPVQISELWVYMLGLELC